MSNIRRKELQGTPHLLPIIDSNKPLDFKDDSGGRKRRTLKMDCPYEFGIHQGLDQEQKFVKGTNYAGSFSGDSSDYPGQKSASNRVQADLPTQKQRGSRG